MHLTLRGARANGTPGDQIANVLGRNHIKKLTAGGHAHAVDLDEQLPRNAKALVNAKALIQVGVVDQALPAHGGAGLLEIHPHHDLQRVGVLVTQGLEPTRIVQRGSRIVNGARANHDQQALVLAVQDVVDALPGLADQLFHVRAANREEADQVFGRRQHGNVFNAFVICLAGAVGWTLMPSIWRNSGGGLCGHRGLLDQSFEMKERKGKKKPPCSERRRFDRESESRLQLRLSSARD